MGLPFFIQNWLRTLLHQRVREAVVQAAEERLADVARAAEGHAGATPRVCDVAVVFALANESGGLEDLLEDASTTQGQGFKVRLGGLKGRGVAVVVSGAGRKAAAHATEAALKGHHPPWVISAGFCGGLSPALKRHDLVVADSVVDAAGRAIDLEKALDPAAVGSKVPVHVGRILTADEIVRTPRRKRVLGEEHRALAVDLESLTVAEVCRRQNVRCAVVRVVSDAVDEELPKEVSRLVRQKSTAGRLGAALGAILDRPGSLKEMMRLKENALVASDRLAKFLAAAIVHLCPKPPAPV